jgi:hypothetical protein
MLTFTEDHGLGLKPRTSGQLQCPRYLVYLVYLVYLLSRTLAILGEYLQLHSAFFPTSFQAH